MERQGGSKGSGSESEMEQKLSKNEQQVSESQRNGAKMGANRSKRVSQKIEKIKFVSLNE